MTRRPSLRHSLPVLSVIAGVAACGGDDDRFDPLLVSRVETSISANDIEAGTTIDVTCVAFNARDEQIVGGNFEVAVTPSEGVTGNGLAVNPTRAGTYAIACVDVGSGATDETPETAVVRAGPAERTSLTLTPATIEAGDTAETRCVALDAFGNEAAANLRLESDPREGLTLTGTTGVSATVTGTWELTCFAATVAPVDLGKATLEVVPGARAGIVLTANPSLPSYGVRASIRIAGEAVDAYGNLRGEAVAIQGLDAAPAGQHSVLGDANDLIRFNLEGKYTVSAAAADIPAQTATLDIVVDQTAPELVLELPERGVVTDSLETLRFKGTVTDNLGEVASLMVGPHEVTLAEGGGAFDVEVPLAYGLNLFDVVAMDPYGNTAMTTRGAERSSDYYAMNARTIEADGVDNALAIVMTQDAIDDGVQDDGKRDDLASIIQFVLENIDFASFVNNPLTSFACIGGQCTVDLTSVTFDSVDVDMPLRNGRVGFQATLRGFEGTITLWFPCAVPGICQTNPQAFPGTLEISEIVMTSDIALSIADGEARARAENTDVVVGDITVNISGDPTGLTSAAVNILLAIIGPVIGDVMEVATQVIIEEAVAGAFGGLFSALALDTDFELPSVDPNGTPNTIKLRTAPKGIDIAPQRLQVRMNAMATPLNPARPREHLGSIGHTGCAPMTSLTFPPPDRITVGLHDDFINQLLFAVWEGGTVNFSLAPPASDALLGSFGFTGATLTVDALLPPVFNSCQARDSSGNLDPTIVDRAQLAELYVEILLPGGEGEAGNRIALWLLAEAPVGIDFGTNDEGAAVARLVVEEIAPLFVEVVANEGLFEGDDESVRLLVQDVLIPQLLGIIEESASFALPAIDLGALTTAVPAGTTLNLKVGGVGRDNAYMTVFGALE